MRLRRLRRRLNGASAASEEASGASDGAAEATGEVSRPSENASDAPEDGWVGGGRRGRGA